MKCLLLVAFAAACGGAVPMQSGPGIEYPRGGHAMESPSRCRIAQMQHAVNYFLVCDFTEHR